MDDRILVSLSVVIAVGAILLARNFIGFAGYQESSLSCEDTDGGQYDRFPGTVIVHTSTGAHFYPDRCTGRDELLEGICVNNKYTTRVESCSWGCNSGDGEAFCQKTRSYDSWEAYDY